MTVLKRKKRELGKKNLALQATGVLMGMIAVLLTLIFGIRSEQIKVLQVQYMANLSLLRAEAITGEKITVSYGNQSIANLSKLLGRLRNTGSVPILAQDIEEPLTLSFESGRILEIEISQTHPQRIPTRTSHDDRSATISHGLLNPGDWIEFQILVDGTVDWPRPSFRISGIPEPSVSHPAQFQTIRSITLPALPRSVQYMFLAIVSIATIACFVFAGIGFKEAVSGLYMRPERVKYWIRRAAEIVQMEITDGLGPAQEARERLAGQLWRILPVGPDAKARDIVQRISFDADHQDLSHLTSVAEKALMKYFSSRRISERLKELNWGAAIVGFLLLLAGLGYIFVVGGSWRLLITIAP